MFGKGVLACVTALVSLVLASQAAAQGFIAVGGKTANGQGVVSLRTDADANDTYEKKTTSFNPWPGKQVGDGVRVAVGDLDGDLNDELVVAAGKGLPVKAYDLNADGTIGELLGSRRVYGSRGVFIAVGDLFGEGRADIITGPASGTTQVIVWQDFNRDGNPLDFYQSFFPFPPDFHGGVRVAALNTVGSSATELVTAQGAGSRKLSIWRDGNANFDIADELPIDEFSPYPSPFRGGLFVAGAQLAGVGDSHEELIVGPGSGPQKVQVRADLDANGHLANDGIFDSFFPYGSGWAKGVRLAGGDTDLDFTGDEVITAPGASTGSKQVKIYDDDGDGGVLISDNPVDHAFTGLPGAGGAYVAFGNVTNATYAFTSGPFALADNGTTTPLMAVPKAAGTIERVSVFIGISHTNDQDLSVTLLHVPTGTSVPLFTNVGNTDDGFLVWILDSAATDMGTADNATGGAITGTFNPEGAEVLSEFAGEDGSGEWRLQITDGTAGNTGQIVAWSLRFAY